MPFRGRFLRRWELITRTAAEEREREKEKCLSLVVASSAARRGCSFVYVYTWECFCRDAVAAAAAAASDAREALQSMSAVGIYTCLRCAWDERSLTFGVRVKEKGFVAFALYSLLWTTIHAEFQWSTATSSISRFLDAR